MPWFPPRLPERCGEWTGLAVPRNTARNPVGTHRETLRVTPRASDGLGSKSSREETNESQKWPFTLLVLAGLLFAAPVAAQKSGGVLKIQHMDTPPSASIHEEATVSAAVPFMSLYNNLVMFDQHAPKNSLETVVPDLATKWDWKDDNRKLVFVLREGVKWHDGQPFTAKDVACTFDLLLGGETKLRRNPRSAWWTNAVKVTADSDTQATFHLKAPQPSLVALLASGYTPIYPCHVPPDQMRRKPVGTGPFKLAEFKMNEGIKLVKNPDYWKKGLPYLDGIEFTIMPDRSTRMLSFIAGKYDMTFPSDVTVPLLKNIRHDAPKALCTMRESGVSVNLIINRESPPFDNPNIRRALALTLDRKAFIDILSEGEDKVAGIMLPPAVLEGLAGFPRRCDVDHCLFVNGNPIVGMDRVSLGVPAERSLPDDRVAEERIATSGKPLVDDAVDRGSGEPACGVVAP